MQSWFISQSLHLGGWNDLKEEEAKRLWRTGQRVTLDIEMGVGSGSQRQQEVDGIHIGLILD